MPDLLKLKENKEKILTIIQSQGPSFPAKIARQTGISPLFTSAFLAELVSEKRLKLSNTKVGSSPLYFTTGQETQLENFATYLNSKEREAFDLLKNSQILADEQQTPAIRVALRSIKDFAYPINVRLDEKTKLFWRYFSLPENQIKPKIQEILTKKQPQTKPKLTPIKSQEQLVTGPEEITKKDSRSRLKPSRIPKPSEFANSIREYLSAKDIEILETLSEKKREFISKIRLDENFGKQSYYLIAKDKKKVSTNDLTIALQNAQSNKMPALFISPGELDKKAKEHLKEWHNLIKFEQIKL